ncbi:hypothetical protein C0J52_05734, partial [Blattella germanica]
GYPIPKGNNRCSAFAKRTSESHEKVTLFRRNGNKTYRFLFFYCIELKSLLRG